MASACVNNAGGWLSPRISFSRDFIDEDALQIAGEKQHDDEPAGKDFLDFEFLRLDDPSATMLPADELISDGKLVPLQQPPAPPPEIPSPAVLEAVSGSDPRVIASPRAPPCSSRWRDLLGLRRQQGPRPVSAAGFGTNPRSLKQFLHRSPKSSSTDSSMSLPLLRDAEVSVSSRRSLSSSSSSSAGDHDDVSRLSLDSEKPPRARISLCDTAPPAVRQAAVRSRRPAEAESPRMNASGRVVFERSSSSPGSFNGGPRPRPRGVERSYSANVRVTQVLNVPVRSLRRSGKPVSVLGLGQLFSPQRKGGAAAAAGGGGGERSGRVKIDRAPPRD